MRIFISHAHSDTDLTEAVVDLMIKALAIPHDQIRCTSVDGYKLPGGASVASQLRREVVEAELVVTILTPTSLASSYVLFELGARWGCDKAMIPVLSKGLSARRVPAPLSDLNLVKIGEPAEAFHFLESAAKVLSLPIARPSVLQSSILKVSQFNDVEAPPQLSLKQSPTASIANLSPEDIAIRKRLLGVFARTETLDNGYIASMTDNTRSFTRFHMDEMVGERLVEEAGRDEDGEQKYRITHEGRRFWIKGPQNQSAF
jgi:hypothetical protein